MHTSFLENDALLGQISERNKARQTSPELVNAAPARVSNPSVKFNDAAVHPSSSVPALHNPDRCTQPVKSRSSLWRDCFQTRKAGAVNDHFGIFASKSDDSRNYHPPNQNASFSTEVVLPPLNTLLAKDSHLEELLLQSKGGSVRSRISAKGTGAGDASANAVAKVDPPEISHELPKSSSGFGGSRQLVTHASKDRPRRSSRKRSAVIQPRSVFSPLKEEDEEPNVLPDFQFASKSTSSQGVRGAKQSLIGNAWINVSKKEDKRVGEQASKVSECFARIRDNWAKKSRMIEEIRWTVGDKQEHEARVEKMFNRAQSRQEFCDVIITSSDKHSIYAHSLVLAAHSKAFEKRLLQMNPGTGMSAVYRLNLTNRVSSMDVAKAVEWMYRGFCRTFSDRLMDLHRTARLFSMVPLVVECLRRKAACERALERAARLKAEQQLPHGPPPADLDDEATSTRYATTVHSMTEAEKTVARYHVPQFPRLVGQPASETPPLPWWTSLPGASTGFTVRPAVVRSQVYGMSSDWHGVIEKQSEVEAHSLSQSADEPETEWHQNESRESEPAVSILSLNADQMFQFLDDDDLDVQSELEVLDAVMTWIATSRYQREIYMQRLLDCVRFYYLSNAELKFCFKQNPSYFKIPLFRNLLGEGLRVRTLIETGQPLPQSFVQKLNRCRDKCHSPYKHCRWKSFDERELLVWSNRSRTELTQSQEATFRSLGAAKTEPQKKPKRFCLIPKAHQERTMCSLVDSVGSFCKVNFSRATDRTTVHPPSKTRILPEGLCSGSVRNACLHLRLIKINPRMPLMFSCF